jgi:hypothetical protein
MTIKIPKENFIDKLLALIGRKRAVHIPTEAYKKFDQYVYAKAKKESLWRALFRSKNQEPIVGWFYPIN